MDMNRGRGRQGGFTLLELMIVVTVIAILSALAVTSYNRYAFRARRTDAQTMLMRVATAQERYYSTYNKYATSVTGDLKFATDMTENGYYQITVAAINDITTDYIATATPQAGQAKDACANLTLDSHGVKSQSGKTDVNGRCW